MIISWFTQPLGKNASYYQYDTVTEQFSRTRLELGRQSATSTNDTFVSHYTQRTVGFSRDRYSTKDPGQHWTVDKGKLCFDGKPLATKPSANARVYDCTGPASSVHVGNPVTKAPTLPPGIQSKHLALLANEAMVTKATIKLTLGNATQEELIDAIKREVSRVLKVADFAEATDALILETLKNQARQISNSASDEHTVSLDQALDAVKKINLKINEQIDEGTLTPTKEFESAFEQLKTDVGSAQDVDGDVTRALAEIDNARRSLNRAISSIDVARNEATARQLEAASTALQEANKSATQLEKIEKTYDPLTEAESIEEYQENIGIEPEVAI